MKKRILAVAMMAVLALSALTACGKKAPAQTVYVEEVVVEDVAPTTGMANPYVEYGSYDELASALGYYPLGVTYTGLDYATYNTIDSVMADIRIMDQDDTMEVMYRTVEGSCTNDTTYITGLYDMEWNDEYYVGDVYVYSGTYASGYVYYWEYNGLTFCVETMNLDDNSVADIIEMAIATSTTL